MPTRGQLAREAAAVADSIASRPSTTIKTARNATPKIKAISKANTKKTRGKTSIKDEVEDENMMDGPSLNDGELLSKDFENSTDGQLPASATSVKKRKRAAPKKTGLVNGEVVTGGWDELPHNMGKISGANTEDVDQSDDVLEAVETATKRGRKSKASKGRDENNNKEESLASDGIHAKIHVAKKSTRGKAKKSAPVTPESSNESDGVIAVIKAEDEQKPKNKTPRIKKIIKTEDVQEKVDDLLDAAEKSTKKAKKPKKNPYGLTPGETPFPDFPNPTPKVCQQVNDLLAGLHGEVKQPEKVPAPSLEVSGCGEVPSVLDAMIRTLLSAATTGANSSRAFQGLINRYGKLEEGIGKGSVNWYKVHESPLSDVFEAIKSGGLAKTKSQRIKEILNLVYTQNIERRDAFIKEKESGAAVEVAGADIETRGQKDLEIAKADNNILSLDHLHALSAEDAMTELTKFPGIGVKTASCVILFCMQRPSFAVDTHVWRLCKWLKWVPDGATRDQTFSHCEVRVPDHLKYPLHQLFIRHGKTCGRCRANTGTASEDFINAECPIDHLVTRTGKRKDESTPKGPPKKRGGKKKKSEEWDSEAEESEKEEGSPELSDTEKDE